METVRSFRDLDVWQVRMNLVVEVYEATEELPVSERYGLSAQMHRAVVSIPSNVAEGHARKSDGAYLNHVRIALGSQAELGTEIELAARLGFLRQETAAALLLSVGRVRQLLYGLRRSIEHRRDNLRARILSVLVLMFWATTLFA